MQNFYKLFELIKTEYKIDSQILKIEPMNQYPHMFFICLPNHKIIVKCISKLQTNCFDINLFYSSLEDNEFILKPKKTRNGNYSINFEENVVLLYKECLQLHEDIEAKWWAQSLNSIHSTKINKNFFSSFSKKIYCQTITLLEQALNFMEEDIKNNVQTIFCASQLCSEKINSPFVLCHNDPYNQNVMQDKNLYKFIDTEGMGLAPLEYDIQRLFYNQALLYDDVQNLENFIEQFINKYESLIDKKINMELLKNIYSCDLIRSIAWLYLVSNDENRLDRERQSQRLELYKDSLRKGIHTKILKKI